MPRIGCGADRPHPKAGAYDPGSGVARARWPSRSSKPARCGNPTLARFDSGAAPLLAFRTTERPWIPFESRRIRAGGFSVVGKATSNLDAEGNQ
jgi:hypothetical protein